jgi:ribonuclease D
VNNLQSTITKEELAGLEPEAFCGRIIVADNALDARKAVEFLSRSAMLGFDTESRPSFRKGSRQTVALVQIATADTCVLFRSNKGHGFYPALVELLTNPDILKIGLSLRDDFNSISRNHHFVPLGFIDLQDMVHNYGIEELSLTKIYAILFGKKISKGQRLTNWEAGQLTELQKRYAALDAWACLKIYERLCSMPKSA